MEFAGYMKLEGDVQGSIEGSSARKSREGSIELFSFEHEIKLPTNMQSGIGNGPVIHQPIKLLKEIDKSTPKLYRALVEKERLNTVKLEWFRYTPQGEELVYYRVELTNAYFLSIAPWTPQLKNPESEYLLFMENVSLAYEGISWSWGPDGDVTYQTNWRGEQ
ncbi:MAG: type VI secretion system secreted protein Hcp [Paraglaciecola sp.]|jgi:type VI secretion system secreted protein Hcp